MTTEQLPGDSSPGPRRAWLRRGGLVWPLAAAGGFAAGYLYSVLVGCTGT